MEKVYVSLMVSKELAEKFRSINEDTLREEEFNNYIETVKDTSKKEFRSNLESLEEDVAMYNGLMINVKRRFEDAKNEQLNTSYALWEKIDEEIPRISNKTNTLLSKLKPITEELDKISNLLKSINTYNFDRVNESLSCFVSLANGNKEFFEYLVKFYTIK